jgi:hypothetical protein
MLKLPVTAVAKNAKFQAYTAALAVIVTFAGKNLTSLDPLTTGTSVTLSAGKLLTETEIRRACGTDLPTIISDAIRLASKTLQHWVVIPAWKLLGLQQKSY